VTCKILGFNRLFDPTEIEFQKLCDAAAGLDGIK